MNLTPEQIEILEAAYNILAQHRLCADFNETHDLTVSDALQVIDELLNYTVTFSNS
jgi:hypothetical protein